MAKNSRIQLLISAKDKATKTLMRISAKVKSWGLGITKTVGGFGAAVTAVGAAVTWFGVKVSGLIDQQGKVADKLGITTEKLSELRDAAEDANISSNTLDMALQRMVRRVAEAANGTGEAVDALAELGLNAEALNRMSPDQVLEKIVGALDDIENQSDKVRLAFKLFDSEGVSMVNLTRKGLQQAADDAAKLGIKLTTAQTKSVEAANDSASRVRRVWDDFTKYVVAELSPAVKKGFDAAFDFIKGKNLKNWAAETALAIAKAFQNTVVILGGVAEGVIAITRAMVEAFKLANEIVKRYSALNYKASSGSVKMAEDSLSNMKAQGVPESNYYYQQAADNLAKEKEKAQLYINMAYQAEAIEESLTAAAEKLAGAQGFSQSPAADRAMKELQSVVEGLNKKTEETSTKAAAAKQSIKIFASDSAEALDLVGTKAERINSALEKLTSKEWKINIKGMERFSVDGVDQLSNLLDDGVDR